MNSFLFITVLKPPQSERTLAGTRSKKRKRNNDYTESHPCSSRPRNAGVRIQQASKQTNITASTSSSLSLLLLRVSEVVGSG